LLLVLMALFLLTAAVMAFASLIRVQLENSVAANRGVEAKAMAHSGYVVARASLQQDDAKQRHFEEELGPGLGFRARVIGEGGKLNINDLVKSATPEIEALFIRWLSHHGLNLQEADRLRDCMVDWLDDNGDLKELNGQEAEGEYQPLNREFASLDEVAQVAGVAPLLKSRGWRDDLTVIPAIKQIDLTSASPSVLALLEGVDEARLARFLAIRRGKDGVDGTPDDVHFTPPRTVGGARAPSAGSGPAVGKKTGAAGAGNQVQNPGIELALDALGLAGNYRERARSIVALESPVVRIISDGYATDIVHQLEVVTEKRRGGKTTIYSWKE